MTHPNDFAALCDLLDGRLPARAEEEVRRRLGEEPDLAAAWEELRRMRQAVRTLPTPPLPESFAAQVRSAAGIPQVLAAAEPVRESAARVAAERPPAADAAAVGPPVPVAATSPAPASPAPMSSDRAPGAEPAPGRVLSFRWLYAAAAVLGIGIGVAVYLAQEGSRDEVGGPSREVGRSGGNSARHARDHATTPPPVGQPSAGSPVEPTRPAAEPGASESDEGRRNFRGPANAVPPGLRTPSDDTGAAAAPARAEAGHKDAGDAPASPPSPLPSPAAPTPAASSRTGSSPAPPVPPATTPPTEPAPPPVTVPPETSPPVGLGVPAPAPGGPPPEAPSQFPLGMDGGTAGKASQGDLGWAFSGVDDVVLMEAPSLDDARARVALFYVQLRGGPETSMNQDVVRAKGFVAGEDKGGGGGKAAGSDAKPAAPKPAAEPDPEPSAAKLRRVDRSVEPKDADAAAAARLKALSSARAAAGRDAVAPPPGATLGTFVLTLSPEEAARLDAALAGANRGPKAAGEGGAATGPGDGDAKRTDHERDSVSKEREAAAEKARRAAPPAERVVRIVVVREP